MRRLVLSALFGDRTGLLLFLGLVLVYGLTWRLGVFITDSQTLLNMMHAMADGHLYMEEAVYSGSLDTPGTYTDGTRIYGRNYGQAIVSLPAMAGLWALSRVTPLPLAIAALWSGGVLLWCRLAGRYVDREALGTYLGSGLALFAFVANLLVLRPVTPPVLELAGAQLTTFVLAAFIGVVTYRIVSREATTALGVGAALVVTLATPIGIWATIPKRHVVTALVLVAIVYAVQRSRDPDVDRRRAVRFRALAYACVGLLAWFHQAEAIVTLVALAAVDLPTAATNDRRALAVIGGAFVLSTLPFALTNYLATGDPLLPTRFLTRTGSYTASGGELDLAGKSGGGGGSGSTSNGPVAALAAVVQSMPLLSRVHFIATTTLGFYTDGLTVLFTEPGQIFQIFVSQTEQVSGTDRTFTRSLSFLESAPIVAAVVAMPVAAWRRVRRRWHRSRTLSLRFDQSTTVSTLVLALVISHAVIYLPRLPLHAQVTVRYLVHLYPLVIVGLVRIDVVRSLVVANGRLIVGATTVGLVGALPLLGGYVGVADFSLQGAVLFHGAVSLATAAVLALTLVGSLWDDRFDRVAALALAGTIVAGAAFVLLAGLFYFGFSGPHALPVVRALSDAVALV